MPGILERLKDAARNKLAGFSKEDPDQIVPHAGNAINDQLQQASDAGEYVGRKLGVDKDKTDAAIENLRAKTREKIMRFMPTGFGEGADPEALGPRMAQTYPGKQVSKLLVPPAMELSKEEEQDALKQSMQKQIDNIRFAQEQDRINKLREQLTSGN